MRTLMMAMMLMAGCSSTPDTRDESPPAEPEKTDKTEETGPIVGNDRDEHGCIGSAGYSWCAKEQQCVHPWELAPAKGFDNTPEAFKAYCGQ